VRLTVDIFRRYLCGSNWLLWNQLVRVEARDGTDG